MRFRIREQGDTDYNLPPESIPTDIGPEDTEDRDRGRDILDDKLSALPEVQAGRNLWQNDFHEFDVYEHTSEFVRHLSELTDNRNIRAAGWLHDIGKPVVATPKLDRDGKPIFRAPGQPYHNFDDHESVGEEMVRDMDPEFFISLKLDQDKVASLVGSHYLPMKGIKAMRKTENFIDFFNAFTSLNKTLESASASKEEILDMFVADKLAQGKFCTDQEELFAIREVLLYDDHSNNDLRRLYDMQQQIYGNKLFLIEKFYRMKQ